MKRDDQAELRREAAVDGEEKDTGARNREIARAFAVENATDIGSGAGAILRASPLDNAAAHKGPLATLIGPIE